MAKNCVILETLNKVTEMKATRENGLMTLSGTFGVCGVRNRNSRVYEKGNYAKCVKEMQARIKNEGGIPGELEHPETMNITLENVSHKITSIDIDENGVVSGTIQLLNTPKGQIAQAIVEGGLPLFVSSRAMGTVDKNGNVTLESISSYDLVGTPGFEQARMHLNESQLFESLSDTACIITNESKENDEEINESNDMTKIEELLERLNKLEDRVQELENMNEDLQEQLDEALDQKIDIKKLADGVQKWIIEEYSPELQKWIVEHYQPEVIKANSKYFVENIAPRIQKWIVEDYSPEIEKWVCEHYSPEVEGWFISQVAPGIQKWIVEHFAPEVENWITEQYTPQLMEDTKNKRLESISETLALLESIDVKKPMLGGQTINEDVNEPMYIRQMPDSVRPKYNMAPAEVKESIARRAKIFNFNQENGVEIFWENINFDQIQPAKSIYEGLDTITDQREREIRAQFRRRRAQY